jgi:CubicO group peptidase (beta-lactamase class C family)
VHEIEGLHGAALVTRGDLVEMMQAGGPTGDAAGSNCTAQTRFQIASASKEFAAVMTLLLAEAGTIDLYESVERWLPNCPAHWRPITLHHLLSHTAGVSHWSEASGFVPRQEMSLEQRIPLIQDAPLLSEPGTQWRYSSPGYLVVGHIVARAMNKSYGDLVTSRILGPVGLTSTTAGPVQLPSIMARGFRDGEAVEPWDLAEMPGTGDICSTVGDLAHFNMALYGGSLLAAPGLDAMSTVHAPLEDDSDDVLTTEGYGYGLYVGTSHGRRVLYHPGDNPGYQSFNAWIPDLQASIVILSNDEGDALHAIVGQLLTGLLGDDR